MDGREILEWVLWKYDGKVWTGFRLLKIGTTGRHLCNELSVSINSGDFLD
jgi:hypothetical protein